MPNILHRFKAVAAFASARRADYAELASLEWTALTGTILQLVCGGVAAMLASLFFLGFLSFAVVVTAWDSDWRVATAWLVAGAWFVVLAGGGAVAATAARRFRPFERVRDELSKDVAVVRSAL